MYNGELHRFYDAESESESESESKSKSESVAIEFSTSVFLKAREFLHKCILKPIDEIFCKRHVAKVVVVVVVVVVEKEIDFPERLFLFFVTMKHCTALMQPNSNSSYL